MDGYANTAVHVRKDGTVAAYRSSVRDPEITGLAAFRAAKKECMGRIREMADGAPIIFERMILRRLSEIPGYGNSQDISVFVAANDAQSRLWEYV